MTSLSDLLQQGTAHAWLFIPTAILLGALHGLEPGHSKTMMAAFIIAIRGTIGQAVLLGLAAAISHTAVVWIVALGGQYIGRDFNSEATEPYLQLASAVLVAGVAGWMMWRTWKDQRLEKAGKAHGHHHHGEEVRKIDTGHGIMALEVFEDGVPPRWRIRFETGHGWKAGDVTVVTERPGGARQTFAFVDRGGYLESVAEIPEPHEFVARVSLGHGGHTHDYHYLGTLNGSAVAYLLGDAAGGGAMGIRGGGSDLDNWLTPFLEVMGRKTRRIWAPLYLRGLLGPGERKSLQPMAARLGLSGHDQLQHFIASPAWDDAPLWAVLAREADRLVGGPDAYLVVDDTALPKQGTLSVGVARQYCGQLGKQANCQSLVSLALARREVPVPVALRLFLPDTWTGDADRCARAGVPETEVVPRTKGEIALAELDRLGSAGVRFGTVLADAGYGASAVFRQGLSERGLLWAVGIARNQKVYGAVVQLTVPAGRRRRAVPSEEPREAEAVLAAQPWRRVTWRQGTRGALAARFAAIRVRVGDGPAWGNNRHLPGDEAWLVGEWRSSGERKYYLSNLAPRTSLRGLAAAIKARWVCEQAHQQLKQELGLGHFEGRSWTGLHRHALMTCIAFAYLQHLRLAQHRQASRGKNAAHRSGTAAAPEPACRATGHHRTAVCSPRITRAMSTLQTTIPAAHQT